MITIERNSQARLILGPVRNDQESPPIGSGLPSQGPGLAAVVGMYQQSIGNYLLHLTGNAKVALALTEETFVCAGRARVVSRPGPALRLWLYRVATGLAYRHLGEWRSVWSPQASATRLRAPSKSSENSEAGVVESALRKLRPEDRAILLLADLEQLPFDEAAAIISSSTESFRRRLARVRARFRLAYLADHARVSAYADAGGPADRVYTTNSRLPM